VFCSFCLYCLEEEEEEEEEEEAAAAALLRLLVTANVIAISNLMM
jgi:hypothetical protein